MDWTISGTAYEGCVQGWTSALIAATYLMFLVQHRSTPRALCDGLQTEYCQQFCYTSQTNTTTEYLSRHSAHEMSGLLPPSLCAPFTAAAAVLQGASLVGGDAAGVTQHRQGGCPAQHVPAAQVVPSHAGYIRCGLPQFLPAIGSSMHSTQLAGGACTAHNSSSSCNLLSTVL
jgi:hypothetical protein